MSFAVSAEIETVRIRLGDIATAAGNTDDVNQLLDLDLGRAPHPGRVERIKVKRILEIVRHRLPKLTISDWHGPAEIELTSRSRRIAYEELAVIARESLQTRLGGRWSIQVEDIPRQGGILLPDRPFSIDVASVRFAHRCERLQANVDVISDAHIVATLPLWFSLISSGADQEQDQTGLLGKSAHPKLREAHCRGVLSAFESRKTPVSSAYDITQFEPVIVELRGKGILIEASGIALGNASIGNIVRVRHPESQEAFSAKVISRGHVLVGSGASR